MRRLLVLATVVALLTALSVGTAYADYSAPCVGCVFPVGAH